MRIGTVAVAVDIPELGFAVKVGELRLTECETVNQFQASGTEAGQFTRGYGLVFGASKRKSICVAVVDRALCATSLGEEDADAPAQDAEFVVSHCDNVQASGFLEHIKLPHHVDFEAELEMVRHPRRAVGADGHEAAEGPEATPSPISTRRPSC